MNWQDNVWLYKFSADWVPQLGISFSLALDGLGMVLVLLTLLIAVLTLIAGRNDSTGRPRSWYFNFILTIVAVLGVFTAQDLFLFYLCWELMLVPMYFLINKPGDRASARAATKFFIYSQAAGLLMLLGILGLYFLHAHQTGTFTFDYAQLSAWLLPANSVSMLFMLGFAIAFAVKMPIVPLHSWAPDAYTYGSTSASILLSSLLSKTGAFGFLRFVLPLFGEQAQAIAQVAMILAVITILYAAVLSLAQTDIKRIIAYTSISHMGFLLLGIFAWNTISLTGVVIIMIAHALSTAGLFIVADGIRRRAGTQNMAEVSGLWAAAPGLGGTMTFFALATMGLPGLANFVGEFLVLLGTFQTSPVLAILAAAGLITSVIYALWIVYRIFHGPFASREPVKGAAWIESIVLGVLIATSAILGVYPQPVFNIIQPAIKAISEKNPTLPPLPIEEFIP